MLQKHIHYVPGETMQHFKDVGCRVPNYRRMSSNTIPALLVGLLCLLAAAPSLAQAPEVLGSNGRALFRFDMQSGFSTEIGRYDLPPGASLDYIAYMPDGRLVGLQTGSSSSLVEIDPQDGSLTQLVPIVFDATFAQGMTIDACGQLWISYFEIDPTTGYTFRTTVFDAESGNRLDEVPAAPDEPLAGFGSRPYTLGTGGLYRLSADRARWDLVLDGLFASGSGGYLPFGFDESGRLWGTSMANLVIGVPIPGSVFEIDLQSGELRRGASHLLDLVSIAIAPPQGSCVGAAVVEIPTANDFGLGVLTLLLATMGAWLLRRGTA